MFKDVVTAVTFIVLPVLNVLGLLNAVHALMRVRSPRGVVAWCIALITIPWIAMPLYWIFGRYKFAGYVKARRMGDSKLSQLVREVHQELAPHRLAYDDPGQFVFDVFEDLSGLKATQGNHLELLTDGTAAFEAMFDAIESAEHYVLAQFFIVNNDTVGRAFQELLIRKARQGVKVCLLIDDIGSRRLPARYVRTLIRGGVEAYPFRSSKGWLPRAQINFRNHRKSLIVDGRIAFTGGYNIGDEYLGKVKKYGPWRDTHVSIVGPAVQSMQIPFLEDWFWITQEIPELEWTPQGAPGTSQQVLVFPSGPADELETCHLFFLEAIDTARERLWICSPYFVPDNAIVSAIQRAALRHVDVRILIPEKPDHLLVYLSAFSYFEEMLKVGVKLYRYRPGFMHQKVLLVDHRLASIGSANLDNRSCFLNFELNVLLADREMLQGVEAMLEKDFSTALAIESDEYDARPFYFKVGVRLARLLSPVQ